MIGKMIEDYVVNDVFFYIDEIENYQFEYLVRLLRKVGDFGFFGVDVFEEYGGIGLDKISLVFIMEKFLCVGSFLFFYGVYVGIGLLLIVFFGMEEQKKIYLLDLVLG